MTGDSPNDRHELLRLIPQVNELVETVSALPAGQDVPRRAMTRAAREAVEELRAKILDPGVNVGEDELAMEALANAAARRAAALTRPSLRRVINATGVVLHTNLGRSPLSEPALRALAAAARGYCNLEYSVEAGRRGSRQEHLEDLLCWLTGSEAAFAVNNNAAAVLLVLSALARGRQAVVSRGQLVEIGDSFRLPDIMSLSGAELVEVGTTNRTKLSDYSNAIGPDTALLMRIHQSNFRMVGYTEEVGLAELVALGRQRMLPVVEDMGSGSLIELESAGLEPEPTVSQSIATGADLVTFSGDKLLGGPQAGIIVGSRDYVESVRKHPLARALRLDKLCVAALEATLRSYLDQDEASREIPALQMLCEPAGSVKARANRLKRRLDAAAVPGLSCEVVRESSRAGGGSLPTSEVPTFCLRVLHRRHSAEELERLLRSADPPVLARVKGEHVLLDLRTVGGAEVAELAALLAGLD